MSGTFLPNRDYTLIVQQALHSASLDTQGSAGFEFTLQSLWRKVLNLGNNAMVLMSNHLEKGLGVDLKLQAHVVVQSSSCGALFTLFVHHSYNRNNLLHMQKICQHIKILTAA